MSREDRFIEEFEAAEWARIHHPGIIKVSKEQLNKDITSIAATIDSIQDMNGYVEPELKRLEEIIALARQK